jgi:Leucine-rich repeat (LRR) protein
MQDLPRNKLQDIIEEASDIINCHRKDILTLFPSPTYWTHVLTRACGDGYEKGINALVDVTKITNSSRDIIRALQDLSMENPSKDDTKIKLIELTEILVNESDLEKGTAYWAIESWAKALNIGIPPAETFSCTWKVTVEGQYNRGSGRWDLLGTTPCDVTIPPDHRIKLVPTPMSSEDFSFWVRRVEMIERVEYLDLAGQPKITDKNLSVLKQFLNLVGLDLSTTMITNGGLTFIGDLRKLDQLHLNNCRQISDKGLNSLCTLGNLTSLWLTKNQAISKEGLEYLSRLPSLSKLTLRRTGIKGKALSTLEKKKSLQLLDISYTDISDISLAYLYDLNHLESLMLAGCKEITDNGIAHLRKVQSLRRLVLSDTKITNKSLEHLKGLKNLEVLELERCWKIKKNHLNTIQRPGLRIILGDNRT